MAIQNQYNGRNGNGYQPISVDKLRPSRPPNDRLSVLKIWRDTTPTDSTDSGLRCKQISVKENAVEEIKAQPYF